MPAAGGCWWHCCCHRCCSEGAQLRPRQTKTTSICGLQTSNTPGAGLAQIWNAVSACTACTALQTPTESDLVADMHVAVQVRTTLTTGSFLVSVMPATPHSKIRCRNPTFPMQDACAFPSPFPGRSQAKPSPTNTTASEIPQTPPSGLPTSPTQCLSMLEGVEGIPLSEGLHDVAVHVQHCFARLGKFTARGQQGPPLWAIQPPISVDFRTQHGLQHQHSTLWTPAG